MKAPARGTHRPCPQSAKRGDRGIQAQPPPARFRSGRWALPAGRLVALPAPLRAARCPFAIPYAPKPACFTHGPDRPAGWPAGHGKADHCGDVIPIRTVRGMRSSWPSEDGQPVVDTKVTAVVRSASSLSVQYGTRVARPARTNDGSELSASGTRSAAGFARPRCPKASSARRRRRRGSVLDIVVDRAGDLREQGTAGHRREPLGSDGLWTKRGPDHSAVRSAWLGGRPGRGTGPPPPGRPTCGYPPTELLASRRHQEQDTTWGPGIGAPRSR
jgi:hypothetical protein